MMDKAEAANQATPEMKRIAAQRARERAKSERWDLGVAVFLFAVLIIVIILLFGEVGVEVVVPVAAVGLAMGWLGRAKGKQAYKHIYDEELLKLIQGQDSQKSLEETIEEKVQRAFRERRR